MNTSHDYYAGFHADRFDHSVQLPLVDHLPAVLHMGEADEHPLADNRLGEFLVELRWPGIPGIFARGQRLCLRRADVLPLCRSALSVPLFFEGAARSSR